MELIRFKRDANTRINPNKWAFFDGFNEGGENAVDCFRRELEEEIGLRITRQEALPIRDYLNVELKTYRYFFYIQSGIDKSSLVLGEGAGFDWIPLN